MSVSVCVHQAASRRSDGQLTVTQAASRWRSTNDLPRHCLIAFPEPEPAQFRTLDVSTAHTTAICLICHLIACMNVQ